MNVGEEKKLKEEKWGDTTGKKIKLKNKKSRQRGGSPNEE